jgi:hypothetical protein
MGEELSLGSCKKIKCNQCKNPTNHELKAFHRKYYDDSDGDNEADITYSIDTQYRLWVCLGCNTAVFEIEEATLDMEADPYCNQTEQVASTYYPARKDELLTPKYFEELDTKLNTVYREVIKSYNAQLKIICAMGLRALLEGICIQNGITDKEAFKLTDKLKKLKEKDLLPSDIVGSLDNFKFLGDDAAHKLETPSQSELKAAIGFMDELLSFLYDAKFRLASKAHEADAEIKSKRKLK